MKKLGLFFICLFYTHITLAQASNVLKCLDLISNDFELNGTPHHPNNYYFAVNEKSKNQFLLIEQKKSFLCTTDSELKSASVIDIINNLPGLSKKKILYSKTKVSKEKSQSKDGKKYASKGYLIPHQELNLALEVDEVPGISKNIARCEVTQDEGLVQDSLIKVAENEILDLTADWSEKMDSIDYSWGTDKKEDKRIFETKLQSVLEKCSQTKQLLPVTKTVAKRIGLKSTEKGMTEVKTQVQKKPSLPAKTKQ